MGKVYGELYIDAGATSQTLSAASAYARLDPGTEWTAGASNILTLTATDGTITLTQAGTYMISFWAAFTTASLASGTAFRFKYALDGSTSSRILPVYKTSNGVDTLTVSAIVLVSGVTVGQVLSIYVGGDATSSGTAITVLEAGLTTVRLSE